MAMISPRTGQRILAICELLHCLLFCGTQGAWSSSPHIFRTLGKVMDSAMMSLLSSNVACIFFYTGLAAMPIWKLSSWGASLAPG